MKYYDYKDNPMNPEVINNYYNIGLNTEDEGRFAITKEERI